MSQRFWYNASLLLRPAIRNDGVEQQCDGRCCSLSLTEFDFESVAGVAAEEEAVVEHKLGIASRSVVDVDLRANTGKDNNSTYMYPTSASPSAHLVTRVEVAQRETLDLFRFIIEIGCELQTFLFVNCTFSLLTKNTDLSLSVIAHVPQWHQRQHLSTAVSRNLILSRHDAGHRPPAKNETHPATDA